MPRPKKLASDRRTDRIDLHWSSVERKVIEDAANAVGLSMAAYVRHAALLRAKSDLDRARTTPHGSP